MVFLTYMDAGLAQEVDLLDREFATASRLTDEAGTTFSPKAADTFRARQDWYFDLVKLGNVVFGDRLKLEDYTLGRAVASVYLNAVAEADDWFDQHKSEFAGKSPIQIRELFLGFAVGGLEETPVVVGDVIAMVEEYAGLLPEGERKNLALDSLAGFSDVYEALAWEVSGDVNTYDHKQAWNHKKRTLDPYMTLGYAVGCVGELDRRYMNWTKNVILAAQIDNDIKGFDEDLAEGTVNVAVGFYHELKRAGVADRIARNRAIRKTKGMAFEQKIESGYYFYGMRMMAYSILGTMGLWKGK